MKENQPWAVVSDVEGPLKNGKYDGAKHIMETLVKRKLMTQEEMDTATGKFDEHDDNKDRVQRFVWSNSKYPILGLRPRWSTGTLPGIAICYAARAGLKQSEVYEMTKAGDVATPGANEFLIETKEKEIPIYLLTSAEPSVSLRLGKEMGIPSSRIYSMGYRPSPERLAEYDKNPNPEAEAEERSMLNRLLPHRTELESWFPVFIKTSVEWEAAYEAGSTEDMLALELEQSELFNTSTYTDEFLKVMRDLYLHQKVLKGSHQKGEDVHAIARNGYRVIYIGGNIVDTMPALVAGAWEGYGIAVNSTSDDLNYAADLLLGTTDMRAMNLLRDDITKGLVDVHVINHKYSNCNEYTAFLFSGIDFRNNPEDVMAEMRGFKSAVKKRYSA